MFGMLNRLSLAGLMLTGWAASAETAFAQGQGTTITSSGWVAIGIIGVLVLLVILLISGSLSLSRRSRSRDDADIVGVLEGVDEEEDSRRD